MEFSRFYGYKSKFVYYENLKETHPDIYYSLANSRQMYKDKFGNRMKKISANLLSWATIEAKKEINLLKHYFNTNIDLSEKDLYSKDIGIELTKGINNALQFKEAFQRHLTRILGPEGRGKGTAKITGAQFFSSYFEKELYKLVQEEISKLDDNIVNLTIEELVDKLFSDDIIQKALYNTFFVRLKQSGDWSKNSDKKGYKELFEAIEKFNKSSFLKSVSEAYHLDEFRERLLEQIESSQDLKDKLTIKKSGENLIKKSLKESTTAKGTLGEILGEQSTAAVIKTLQQETGENFHFNSKVIGSSLGKADYIASLGIDLNPILDIADKIYKGRETTVSEYKKINQFLENIDDGFLIYTNAKDYSLIKNHSKGYNFNGFSTGSDINLKTFEGVVNNTPGKSQELIGRIMSTMKGAVLEDELEDIEDDVCEKLAYFLFDDVLTIGKETKASSHAIHLLMLDGVYIPLSYLFYLMSEAVTKVSNYDDTEIRKIFDVTIEPGEIEFPEGPWDKGAWVEQKQEAYNNITIGAKFLKSFEEIISELR